MLNYRIILIIITYLKLNRLKANCSPEFIDYMINTKYVKKKLQLSVEKLISFNKYTLYGKTAYSFEINKDLRTSCVIFRPIYNIKEVANSHFHFFRIYFYFSKTFFT